LLGTSKPVWTSSFAAVSRHLALCSVGGRDDFITSFDKTGFCINFRHTYNPVISVGSLMKKWGSVKGFKERRRFPYTVWEYYKGKNDQPSKAALQEAKVPREKLSKRFSFV